MSRTDSKEKLLEFRGLTVSYQARSREKDWALMDFSATLAPGEAVGIVGESGAGKSTIGLALLGLLPADAHCEGSIIYRGKDIVLHPKELARLRWKNIALLSQDSMNAFNPVTTIGEQIAELHVFFGKLSWKDAFNLAATKLGEVGLPGDTVKRFPHELSGGMRQRAALAMALALEPEIMFVDEPTAALDVITGNEVIDVLNALRKRTGITLVMTSHDISAVARTCDRLVVLRRGRQVESGPVSKILSTPQDVYTRALIRAVPVLGGQLMANADYGNGNENNAQA